VSTAHHPFRFSSPIGDMTTGPMLRDHVRRLEDIGYSTVTIADHFDSQLGPITALMAAADATTTMRVASLVFCNDYRHPVVLSKEAATLDLLSDGRFEFGLGAGWKESDYDQAGMTYDPAPDRVDRMEEALTIIRGMWSPGTVTFTGDHYRIDDLEGTPKPVTPGGPPVIIGGGGKRVLQLGARMADIVGLNPKMAAGKIDATAGPSATPQATDRKIAWIREAAGDRFDDIELQVRLELAILTDDPDPLFESLSGGFGLSPDDARRTPHALVGPVEAMCDALIERRERWGLSYIGVPVEAAEALAPVVARLAGT